MMRYISLVVLFVILGFTGCHKKESNQSFKIGVLLPLTGDLASIGEDMKAAILLAKEESKSQNFNPEVIFEDTAFNPAKTVLAAQKLLEVDKVNLIISGGGECGKIVSPLAQKKKIVNFTMGSRLSDNPTTPYDFYHFSQPDNFAKQFKFELDQRGVKSIAIVGIHQSVADEYVAQIQKLVPADQIKALEYVSLQERDFRTVIQKMKSLKPDLLVVFFLPTQLDLFGRQASELKLGIPITTFEGFDFAQEPKWFEGFWFINVPEIDSSFGERLKQKGGTGTFVSGYCYDIYRLIERAYETNKGGESLEKALIVMPPYEGQFGAIQMLPNGSLSCPAVTRIMKNGKSTTLRKFLNPELKK